MRRIEAMRAPLFFVLFRSKGEKGESVAWQESAVLYTLGDCPCQSHSGVFGISAGFAGGYLRLLRPAA